MSSCSAARGPLAEAIDEFLEELKSRDRKGRFYHEVLNSRAVMAAATNQKGVNACAGELLDFVKQLEQRKQASKTVRVLGAIGPFIDGMQNMMTACQTMIQASPFAVGVVFAGAQIVLGLAQNVSKAFDIVIEAMVETGASLKCYAKFAVAYETCNEVRERLVASYKTIVSFWATATKLLDQNYLIGTIKNIFRPLVAEMQGTVDSLRRDCARVEAIAQAEEAVRANEDRKRARAEQEEKLKNGIRDWIAAGDDLEVRCDLQMHSERRHGTTCAWIFEDEKFQHWRDSTSDPVLWYNAPPGSGKTVLSSAVVKHLTERGLPMAYFFYSFSDFTKRKPLSGPKALALQLMNILKTGIPDRVIDLYREEITKNMRHMRLRDHAIEVLHEYLKQCPLVYIVVDGLDESLDDENMRYILSSIVRAPVYGTVKWFFTSRNEGQIQGIMKNLNAVFLSPTPSTLAAEIKLFLTSGLQPIAKSLEHVDDYVEYSEGSFLYSKFLLDTLRGKGVTCDRDIQEALHGFPQGLTGYYMRSLLRLAYRSPPERDLVRRLFTILVTAVQSVTWNELCNALAIRPGAQDYSIDSVPQENVIHGLCGSLLLFDRSSEESKNNPRVKLFHKTIQDFLLEDPQNLPIDKSFSDVEEFTLAEMKKLFIDPTVASVQVGRNCMTLLQYRRYKSFSEAKAILDDTNTENAFLKYAAAFWFLHLICDENHSKEAFEEVRKFMESPNFWTCVAVQSYVVPYNFGRYAQAGPTEYKMGVRRADWSKDDCFAVPLPNWLGQYPPYGPQLDMDFCSFVSDWHEVLASRPGTLGDCVPLSTMKSRIGDHLHRSERIKVWRSNEKMDLKDIEQLQVTSMSLSAGKLFAELICKERLDPPGRIHYHRVSVFSKGTKIHSSFDTGSQLVDLATTETDFQVLGSGSQTQVLEFDGSHLQLKRTVNDLSQTFSAPNSWKPGTSSQAWRVQWKNSQTVPHGKLVLFHVVQETAKRGKTQDDDTDSDSSDSESDSDSDSSSYPELKTDSDTTAHYDSGYDDGPPARTQRRAMEKAPTDCVILVWESSQPLWIPVALDQRVRQGIPFAMHPYLPIVTLNCLNGQTLIANLDTGVWHNEYHQPALNDDKFPLVCQELHFSSCGQLLHTLQASFREQPNDTECQLSLSTSRFIANQEGHNWLDHPSPVRRITYRIKESLDTLPSDLILAHWGEGDLVVALPPLTCEPKIVRLSLPRLPDAEPHPSSHGVQTLQNPIYFPSSATTSGPVLLYRHRSSPKDHELFLALTQKTSACQTTVTDGQPPSSTPCPVVIRWRIPNGDGWRDWNSDHDEQSEDLKRGVDDARILRGGFVDGDKQFYVPIRSGLDWTRKGYLTCS
ncbi:uncharacterized protein N7482_006963 [Penicillium canariense]|uniref:NACHT domain-containing protein n=1 Tax=Penicillium canariense TaxID=189055 RepID=A0A9W9HVU6_9EURO|nr:uncharacterized protein N7482_006963 [Penicillium canariense]KAJ5159959.1 hypothetical protein N7482_006963 [Penicillium canariense]